MKNKIGEVAGIVWRTLGEKEDVDILKLPKIMKEKEEIVYQALGWLAREDKINYHNKERKTFVSLSYDEREMFKNSFRAPLNRDPRENSQSSNKCG
jgi:hypothetical protein